MLSWGYNGPDSDMRESQQALELRKFFATGHECVSSGGATSNKTLNCDGALDAYAENLIWRLKATSAMVSLIDRGTQYFIAGVTRSGPIDLSATTDNNVISTGSQWCGCTTSPIPGELCENTLSINLENDDYPCFVVSDLTKNPRWANYPAVDGRIASYRFYAGAPIVTCNGIGIGSIFILDDNPREGLTIGQRKFLNQQASNVMKNLEKTREAVAGRRGSLLSRGFADFLERVYREIDPPPNPETFTNEDTKGGNTSITRQDTPEKATSSPTYSQENQESDCNPVNLDMIQITLNRAVENLRQSLELESGGVVFLDTAIGYVGFEEMSDLEISMKESKRNIQTDFIDISESPKPDKTNEEPWIKVPISHRRVRSLGGRKADSKQKSPKILAISASLDAVWDRDLKDMNSQALQNLTRLYPKGNVWYLDENGYFSSLEQISHLRKCPSAEPSAKLRSLSISSDLDVKRSEALMLSRVFIKARQVIFVPLWDASTNRWYAGCFLWSKSAFPVFTSELEMAYLSAFTNSMMVEISRLDIISCDKTKSDFISSISHEFRSPLHGVIASAAFLHDSKLDATQHELVSTIHNCSQTLLDTINHVLDYSKINSFEKRRNKSGNVSNELVRVTNLAYLCEDIIHGMIVAGEFRASGWQDLSLPYPQHFNSPNAQKRIHNPHSRPEVIMDFENRDWVYKVQVGALRRIVMNIFGNAQKYTESGCILVQLSMRDSEGKKDGTPKVLCFRVRDTGRGMSSEYMERRLYHPFAQEDSFAPGVGLGLSIVWSILNQLDGEISICSELGKGTDVNITIPVEKSDSLLSQLEESNEHQIDISDSEKQLTMLKELSQGKSVSLIRFPTSHSQYEGMIWHCIEKYCSNWFGFRITDSSANIIVTDQFTTLSPLPDRVLIINEGIMNPQKIEDSLISSARVEVAKPLGPYKLARSLLALLKKNLPSESTGDKRLNLSNASTQTPIGTPAERAIMSSIIMMDYGFPEISSLPENLQSKFDETHGRENARTVDSMAVPDLKIKSKQEQISIQSTLDSQTKLILMPPPDRKNIPKEASKTCFLSQTPVLDRDSKSSVNETVSVSKFLAPIDNRNYGLSILAVDDNALNLQLLERYLLKRKCDTVVIARNGFEAVASFKERGHFDVVLMDISMPEMSGFEATRHIRAFEVMKDESSQKYFDPEEDSFNEGNESNNLDHSEGLNRPETKKEKAYIVAITGLASCRDREEAARCGLDNFLTKPVNFTEIGRLLKILCGET